MTHAPPFRDTFTDDQDRGHVIGSRSRDGVVRDGVDVESVLSIDNGALRIEPLIRSGWQRACLSYGPFDRRPGLVLAVSMINGHNTAQAEQLPDTLRARLNFWLLGSRSTGGWRRLWRWTTAGRIQRGLRQFRWWAHAAKGRNTVTPLDENLSVGWFPTKVCDPIRQGSAFVMHATGPENGELWRRVGNELQPVIRGVQNVHIYYVVALRPGSAAYYAASVPGANGLTAYPLLRPLGIDSGPDGGDDQIWASIHQSVLGQIGFRLDTRVYGVAIAQLPTWEPWHGGAHAADTLEGDGPLDGSRETLGRAWSLLAGRLCRTSRGVEASDGHGVVTLEAPEPSGLIRCVFSLGDESDAAAALWWRIRDAANRWELCVLGDRAELAVVVDGERATIATDVRAVPHRDGDLQVVDDGRTLSITLNGCLLFGGLLSDVRHGDGAGLAIALHGNAAPGPRAARFEAHPRTVRLPAELDVGRPWYRLGQRLLVSDDFSGAAGPLEGTLTESGEKCWQRVQGPGAFERTGGGSARVKADRQRPCPGRTLYAVDWDEPEFADVEVTITPPGTDRGQREFGRAGIVVWQDDDNYVVINLWCGSAQYAGSSVSCFFTIRGWEDVYDAIWTNVGSRVRNGKASRLRVTFDGLHYMAFIDDEPVLCRSLTDIYPECARLQIRRVGLVANWEWGLDTGSVFQAFRVRA